MSTHRIPRKDLRILLLSPYPLRSVPGQRFRFEQYLGLLRDEGIWIDVHPLLDDATTGFLYQRGQIPAKVMAVMRGGVKRLGDVLRAGRYDLVFIYREAFPLGYPVVEHLLGTRGVPYIYDFDDAIYLTNVSDANRWVARFKYSAKTATITRHARLVLAGNHHLADWAKAFNDRVRVVPTTIDTDLYQPRAQISRKQVCVGWSGSPTTIVHFKPLTELLVRLQRSHGIRIRVIGDPNFSVVGAEVEALPWRESCESEDLAEIDIGVMPLPDDEWARGKCGLKALQYMALAIPTVMSPVGVNTVIARNDAARLASTEQDWQTALTDLIEDEQARRELGMRGRARVEADYSVRATLPYYVEAIRSAVT